MKIILCIFLLYITAVFGGPQELNSIVGKSIEFPAAVETGGSLMYGSKVIGRILGGELIPLTTPEYQGRVQWDKRTGLFSLSGLRLEDSGVYTVEKDDGQKSVSFSLTVWIPVSKPHLSVTRNEYRCTVLCAAARGTGATLTLYKNGEKNPYVTSPVRSHPHLDMTQTVERSSTYTCEAKNSVSRETSDPLTVGAHCTAVSVFGQSVELNGIVGQSVKFPAAVKIEGILTYSGVTIGDVTSGRFTTPRNSEYSGRVQWDSSTGFFSLSELKMEDSGIYTVQNTQQNINTVFQLNVYINVSKPHVSITHNEYPCTLQCTVERGTGVTLSWYREGEKKPYVSSRVASAPGLHLPKTVERSGTYTCEARNSVSNEKASITVEAHCTAPSGSSTGTIVASVIAVLIVALIAVVFAVLYCRTKRKRRVTKCELEVTERELEVTKSKLKEILDKVDPHAYDSVYLDKDTLDTFGDAVHPEPQYVEREVFLDGNTMLPETQYVEREVFLDGNTMLPETQYEQLQAIPPDDTRSKSKELLRLS